MQLSILLLLYSVENAYMMLKIWLLGSIFLKNMQNSEMVQYIYDNKRKSWSRHGPNKYVKLNIFIYHTIKDVTGAT